MRFMKCRSQRAPLAAPESRRFPGTYFVLLILFSLPELAISDGVVIDRIYHPYVQQLEQELEWRAVSQDDQPGVGDGLQTHRFAYGRSLGERWFGEVYLVGEKSDDDAFEVSGYELEASWQATERGEGWADWGLVFEFEKEANAAIWEFATGILVEKEFGRWSGTANFFVAQEWGPDIPDEVESRLGLQLRYRYSRLLEPAIEFYSGQDTRGLGPVFLGQINLGIKRQVKWEAGIIYGLDDRSPNQTLRFLLEWEF